MADPVAFTNVGKQFGGRAVLTDVSFSLPQGQTLAVVGESGCGKTTLLQLVNGVWRADRGEVRVFDAPIPDAELEAFRRRIGYAVQGAALFPHLTCRDNVTLLARLDRSGAWDAEQIESRYRSLLTDMGLSEELSDRYPHEVSGGQQQRLGLCRALMLAPELLLLDEPFSAIDPITRVSIYEEFEQVQARANVTVMLVTHDMREAVRLADQIMILREGVVAQCAPTDSVVQHPADDYVESLVKKQL